MSAKAKMKAKNLVDSYKTNKSTTTTTTVPKSSSGTGKKRRARRKVSTKVLPIIFILAILLVGAILILKSGVSPMAVAKEKYAVAREKYQTVYAAVTNSETTDTAEVALLSTTTEVKESENEYSDFEKTGFDVVKWSDQDGLTQNQKNANVVKLPINYYDVKKTGGEQTFVVCVSNGPIEVIRNTSSGCVYEKSAFGIQVTGAELSPLELERVEDAINVYYGINEEKEISSTQLLELTDKSSKEYAFVTDMISRQLTNERNFGIQLIN